MLTLIRDIEDARLMITDGHDIIWLPFSLRPHAPGAGQIIFACTV